MGTLAGHLFRFVSFGLLFCYSAHFDPPRDLGKFMKLSALTVFAVFPTFLILRIAIAQEQRGVPGNNAKNYV
jgi:hypothetical protein